MSTEQLEIVHSPRRQRVFVFLAALSAMFAIAGVLAFATLGDDPGSEPPAVQTPRDLVTDGVGGPIAIETQAPTLDDGRPAAVVTPESRDSEPTSTPTAPVSAPVLASQPSFSCDTWSSVIHTGGTKRVGCDLYPAAYAGTVVMRCAVDPMACHAEPSVFDLRGRTAPIPFDVVITTPYDAQPSSVTRTIRMIGGSGQQHPFAVVVPAVTGLVDVECPLGLEIPGTGTTSMPCTLTSTDGFDGNVRLSSSQVLPLGSIGFTPLDVRVPLGETVDVTIPLVSSGLPLGPLALSIDVTPVAWSSGPVSVPLLVTL
jgi:hypothetical protein